MDFLVELLLRIIFIVEVFISFVVEPATNVRKYWNTRKVFCKKSTTKHCFVFFNIKNSSTPANFRPIFPAREYVFREKILNFAGEKQRTLRVLYLHCQQNKEQNEKKHETHRGKGHPRGRIRRKAGKGNGMGTDLPQRPVYRPQ